MEMEILKIDDTIEKVSNGEKFVKIEELYKAIDTDMVECVYLNDGKILVIDEEGKLKGKPLNEQATLLMHESLGNRNDCIVGVAVLIDRKYFD